jgi:hypothetical protein
VDVWIKQNMSIFLSLGENIGQNNKKKLINNFQIFLNIQKDLWNFMNLDQFFIAGIWQVMEGHSKLLCSCNIIPMKQ